MGFSPLVIVLLAGTTVGAMTCVALVAPRRLLIWVGITGAAAATALVLSVAAVSRLSARLDIVVATVFVGIGAFAGGYALGAAILPSLTSSRSKAPRLLVAPDDGSVHVVLLADAEHDEYRPSDVTRVLDLYESSEVPLPPYVARPLVYASEQARYRRAGGSPARRAVHDIAASLDARGKDESGGSTTVAFCSGGPSLAEAVASIAARGGRRIVIAALTVAWTRAFDAAVSDAHALDLSRAGISIAVTDPLWASHGIAAAAAGHALSAFGDHGLEDGVVLVSEGNPWQWDRRYPEAAEQTTFFTQRVRAELIEAGIPAERIRQAWLDWEQPDVPEAVRHLAALGATQIALMPVDFMVQTLSASVDLSLAAEQATFETGIRIEVVPPLGDDPALISSLRRAIARTSVGLADACVDSDLSSPGNARD